MVDGAERASLLHRDVDPVRFEVVRNAIQAVTEEMCATLRRTAYSTNIKTRGDFSCAFFNRDALSASQPFGIPAHLGSLVNIVPQAIAAYGRANLAEGDHLLTNDPFTGGVHLNDITLITPVFDGSDLFGFLANVAHHADVGGSAPGSMGMSSEIYQEGLVIPPIRFVKDDVIDPNIFRLLRANFRGVHEISGDFRAQTAANRLGARRVKELLGKFGKDELEYYIDELIRYTERRVLAELETFPVGKYTAESMMDGDGIVDEPIRFRMTVTIAPDRLTVDLTDCDAQRQSPLNATYSQTYSAICYVFKCLLDSDIPVSAGLYRHLAVEARPGTVVHASHPAAVAAGWEVAMHVCDLMFRALSQAMPDRVMACSKGIACNLAFGGKRPDSGDYFTYYESAAGGYGATLRNDGMDGVTSHIQNSENAPVEETEHAYPVRIDRYELIPDSEGPGRHRGGLGVRRDFAFPGWAPSFSILSDRTRFPPWGLFGGGDARPAHYVLEPDGEARLLPSKITLRLESDAVVSIQTPGGGGCGNPLERPVEAVVRDVAMGYVAPERARSVYGVALDPVSLAVDREETQRLRRGG